MSKIRKQLFIIGYALLIGLTVQTESVFALYSPRLSKQVSVIRKHVQESQAQNGSESILEEIEQIKAYDRAKRAASQATGISGDARMAQEFIFNSTFDFLIQNPLDSLYMVFNINSYNNYEFISTCLRDDIWSLEALRDVVGAEMVKAYMLRDHYHGGLLIEDYQYLVTHLDLLRKYGSNSSAILFALDAVTGEAVFVTSTKYFFGDDNTTNYYKKNFNLLAVEPGCPLGEFEEAFKEVVSSAKTLAVLSAGKGVEWGDIWTMAQANARIRAREWIQANQITLTVGGEEGGRAESLIKGGGSDKFVGYWKTQWEILKNMVGPVTPIFHLGRWVATKTAEGIGLVDECVFYYPSEDNKGTWRNCDEPQKQNYLKCQDDPKTAKDDEGKNIRCDRFFNTKQATSVSDALNKQMALKRENKQIKEDVETAFVFSITMDSVAEQNIYMMDQIMWDMNKHIERGYEAVDKEAGEGIPTVFKNIDKELASKQCANKQN